MTRQNIKTVLIMRNIAILLSCLILLGSCYTQKRAARQMDRAHGEHEVVAAGKCASWYPVRIDTFMGKPVIVRSVETLPGEVKYVNCDSMEEAKKRDTTVITKHVKVKCPDTHNTHDTIYQDRYIVKENTAKVREEELKGKQQENRGDTWRTWAFVFMATTLLLAIGVIIIIRKK